jgi:hypothetical protein
MSVGDVWLGVLGILLAVVLYFEVRGAIEYERRLDRKIKRGMAMLLSRLVGILVPLAVLVTDGLGAGPALARLNPYLSVAGAASLVVLSLIRPRHLQLAGDAAFEVRWLGLCVAGYIALRHPVGSVAGPAVARVWAFVLLARGALRVGRGMV